VCVCLCVRVACLNRIREGNKSKSCICRFNKNQDTGFHVHHLISECWYILRFLKQRFHSFTSTSVFFTQDLFNKGLEQWHTVYSGLPDMTDVEHGDADASCYVLKRIHSEKTFWLLLWKTWHVQLKNTWCYFSFKWVLTDSQDFNSL